jgi:hypothetical protein
LQWCSHAPRCVELLPAAVLLPMMWLNSCCLAMCIHRMN